MRLISVTLCAALLVLCDGTGVLGQTSPGAGPAVVVVETEKGTFEFETYPNEAPKTVAHILALIEKRFYNGQRVHRVVPGFVMQFGDQQTRDMTKEKMWGRIDGPKVGVAEFSKLRRHTRGSLGLAHNGDAAKADTQMYVTLRNAPELDGKYVVFGKVISGMDVVEKIRYADRIVRVTVRAAK
ncbi:MAG TPA: peptidylprolyl isomerase [Vicinamibacterales bacterium]|nr:peptidylprolyl isomerase [Vicinamibacterales bacterium]